MRTFARLARLTVWGGLLTCAAVVLVLALEALR